LGPSTLEKVGNDVQLLAIPATAERKVGGLTIDWSLVPAVGGRNEFVTIAITGVPTGGTFTLTYGGQATGNLAFNIDAAALEVALEGLSSIGNGNVRVSGTNPTFTVEFIADLGKTNATAFTRANSLTGGTSADVTMTVTQEGAADATVSVAGGQVIAIGEKFIDIGTPLILITGAGDSQGYFAPFSSSASDGRQTVDGTRRSEVFIANRPLRMVDYPQGIVGDVIEGGTVYKSLLKVGGSGQPTLANLLLACPGLRFA
jgi:hypothetical protein